MGEAGFWASDYGSSSDPFSVPTEKEVGDNDKDSQHGFKRDSKSLSSTKAQIKYRNRPKSCFWVRDRFQKYQALLDMADINLHVQE